MQAVVGPMRPTAALLGAFALKVRKVCLDATVRTFAPMLSVQCAVQMAKAMTTNAF